MQVGEAFVAVRPDTSKFGPELTRGVETSGRQAGSALSAALAGGIAVAGFAKVIGSASDLQQAIGGTTAVFGESSAAIDAWAANSADAVGLSEASYRQLASFAGNQLKGLGFSTEEAAEQTNNLITMGADLAATFGGTTQEAVSALSATFRGEYDPVERYVAGLRASTVAAKAVEMGLAESGGAISNYARGQATLALLTEGSADAQGQFAEEADTAAGAAARAGAAAENTSASIGSNFLGVYGQAVSVVTTLAEAFGALPGPLQTGVIALGGYIALRAPFALALGSMGTSVVTLRTALTGLTLAGAGLPGLFAALTLGIAAAGDALSTPSQSENFVTRLSEGADITRVAEEIANLNTEVLNYGRAGGLAQVTTDEIERIVAAVAEVDPSKARELGAELERMGVDAAVVAAAIENIPPLTPDEVAAQQAEDVAGLADAYNDLNDAVDEYLNKIQSTEEAAASEAAAQQALFEALRKNGQSFDVNTASGRENIAARNEWVDAVGGQVQAAIDFAAAGGNVEVAQRRANGAIQSGVGDLRAMRDANLITGAQFVRYRDQLLAIPHQVDTEVGTPGAEEARRSADNVREGVNRIPKSHDTAIRANIGQALSAIAQARLAAEAWARMSYTAQIRVSTQGLGPIQGAHGRESASDMFGGPLESSGAIAAPTVIVQVQGSVVGDVDRFADEVAYRAAEKLSRSGAF